MLHIGQDEIARELSKLKDRMLGIRLVKQPSSSTCWAACYAMVARWKGKVWRPWCRFINLQTGTCDKCPRPTGTCDRPRRPAEFLGDWRTLGFPATRHTSDPPKIRQIRRSIEEGVPVQIYLADMYARRAHTMLVVGVAHEPAAGDDLLVILDPSGDVLQIEPSELNRMGHWQETWFIAA